MTEFAAFLVQLDIVTAEDMLRLLDQQTRRRPPIGQLAIRKHVLTAGQVFEVLKRQAHHPERFGEAAMALGLLSKHQLAELLSEQVRQTISLESLLVETHLVAASAVRDLRALFDRKSPKSSVVNTAARPPRPNVRV